MSMDITEFRFAVKDILLRHTGRANAIHGRDLFASLAVLYPNESRAAIEREAREVMADKKLGICSGSCGYFIPANSGEAKDAVRYLNSYIIALADRRTALLKAYPDAAEGVQQEFPKEFEGAQT
jgi:hypothetical protein